MCVIELTEDDHDAALCLERERESADGVYMCVLEMDWSRCWSWVWIRCGMGLWGSEYWRAGTWCRCVCAVYNDTIRFIPRARVSALCVCCIARDGDGIRRRIERETALACVFLLWLCVQAAVVAWEWVSALVLAQHSVPNTSYSGCTSRRGRASMQGKNDSLSRDDTIKFAPLVVHVTQ